jgi:hypothetical protein
MVRIDRDAADGGTDMRKLQEGHCTVIYGAFDAKITQEGGAPGRSPVEPDLPCSHSVIGSRAIYEAATEHHRLATRDFLPAVDFLNSLQAPRVAAAPLVTDDELRALYTSMVSAMVRSGVDRRGQREDATKSEEGSE